MAKLVLMQKNLKRGLARGAHEGDSKTWPGLPELCLLRVIGIIWSTSDMNHHVVSPARLLMGAYLGLCRVRSLRDLASGLFLSTIFFQYEDFSKRLVPEVINFLANCVLHLAPTSFKDRRSIPGTFPVAGSHSPQHLGLTLDVKKAKTLVPKQPDLTQLLTNETVDEQEKLNIFSAALGLLLKGGEMYKGLEGFLELYDPVCSILKAVDSNDLPGALKVC